jgi:hypothetical protein
MPGQRALMPRAVWGVVLLGLSVWYAAGTGPGFVLTSGDDFAYASAAIDLADRCSLIHRFDSPAFGAEYVHIPGSPDAYASQYPLGVSLLLVPFYLAGGYCALFVLSPLMAVLGVVVLYHLAWQLTQRRSVALLAAALLASLPAVVFLASGIDSDMPSLTLVSAALSVYVRHLKRSRPPTFWLFSLLAGASFVVRGPNALLFGVACLHQLFVHRGRWRAQAVAWAGGFLAFATCVALQVGFNVVTFGSPLGGYQNAILARGGFSLAHLPHHLPRYLVVLCVVPPFGLLATLAETYWRRTELHGVYVMLASLVLAFTGLYGSWWVFELNYHHAFIGSARLLMPVVPILCLFVALAALDLLAPGRVRDGLIAACLLAQLGASTLLTWHLYQFKARMAAHRDRIYDATMQRALIVGPGEWNKLIFPRDGTNRVRRYASYEAAMAAGVSGQELVRLVDRTLQASESAYVLGSGSRRQPAEERALSVLRDSYRLVTVIETSTPYELRVDQIFPR